MKVYFKGNVKLAHVNQQSIKVAECSDGDGVEELRQKAFADGLVVRVESHKDSAGNPMFTMYGTPANLLQDRRTA